VSAMFPISATAWAPAAIVLPITAGRLFDLTQGYGVAIVIAAGGNTVGILVSLGLPHQRAVRADMEVAATPTMAPDDRTRG
jgi:hypothetical protein